MADLEAARQCRSGAIDAVHRGEFGKMVALKGNDIVTVPLEMAISRTRVVNQDLIDVAAGLHDRIPQLTSRTST